MDADTDLSGWDYRIVQVEAGGFALREVHFDEDEKPYASAGIDTTYDTLDELRENLAWMLEALDKPVISETVLNENGRAWQARVEAEIADGRTIPWEEIKAELGLGND